MFFGFSWPENPETDWDDKPGLPKLVIPVHFKILCALFGQKWSGMTSLGFPGLSSKSVSGFLGVFRPENPETDWDDKPGLPRLVIPVGLGFFVPFSARKPRNGLGRQAWASQASHPSPFRDFLALFGQKTPKRIGMTSLGFIGFGVLGPFSARKPRNGLG